MLDKLRGFVRIEKRKIDPITREIIPGLEPEVIEASNNMTPLLAQFMVNEKDFRGSRVAVYLAEKKIDNLGAFYGFDHDTHSAGYTPGAITSPELIDNSPLDDYYKIQTRFDPPPEPTTRIINRIMVRDSGGSSYPLATITTLTPCIQNYDEILDVFYKIYIGTPYLAGIGHSNGAYFAGNYKFLRSLFDQNIFLLSLPGYPRRVAYSSFFSKPNGYPVSSGINSGIDIYTSALEVSYDCLREQDFTWGSGSSVGLLYGSILSGYDSVISSNIEFLPSGTSKVQSVFSHGGASNVPFKDDPNPSLGDASITPLADSWDETSNFPQLFKIDITSDGDSSSATYKFSIRDHLSFDGNTCSPYSGEQLLRVIPTFPTVVSHPSEQFRVQCYGYSIAGGTDGLGGDSPGLFADHGFRFPDYTVTPVFDIGVDRLHANPAIQVYVYKYFNNMTYGADSAGVSVADYLNFRTLNIDADYTSPLVVSDVRQVAVDPTTNDIFVACGATGLHRIVFTEGTFSAVVTNITPSIGVPPAGITSAKCFGVDVKDNGDIWAMFDGALGQSTDSGANWTLHDASTAVKFEMTTGNGGYDLTGVGEWVNCRNLKVHPTHGDDRIVIAADGMAWLGWNRANSGVTSASTSNLTHSSSNYVMIHADMPDLLMSKYYRWLEDDVWICRNVSASIDTATKYRDRDNGVSVSILDYAMTDVATNTGSTGIWWIGTGVVSDIDSTDTLRILGHSGSYPHAPRWWNIATRAIDGTIDDSIIYGGGPGRVHCYLGVGKYLAWVSGNVVLLDLSGSGLRDTETNSLMWTDYGWDGGAWVVDHAGSKTAHVASEALVNGVEISFQDAGGLPHFKDTDFYTFSICRGLLKDNSTTASLTVAHPFLPVETGTEISPSTVPGIEGVVVDRPVYWGWADRLRRTDSSTSYFKPGVAAFNDPYIFQQYQRFKAIADERISGDFKFKFKLVWGANTSLYRTQFGVLQDIDHDTSVFSGSNSHWHMDINDSTETIRFYGNGGLEYTSPAITADDVIEFRRGPTYTSSVLTATQVGFYINDTLKHTSSHTSNADVALGIYNPYNTDPLMMFDATISYTSTRRVITMGDSTGGSETGGFSPRFLWMPATRLADAFEVTINGTPATLDIDINRGLPPQAAGEVSLLWASGKLLFHEDDAGKAITAKWISYRDFNPEP